jgi:hypothetical protein
MNGLKWWEWMMFGGLGAAALTASLRVFELISWASSAGALETAKLLVLAFLAFLVLKQWERNEQAPVALAIFLAAAVASILTDAAWHAALLGGR